jgi:chaperonin GroES
MASQPTKLETLTLAEILTPNANLAEFLSDTKLSEIGQKVTRDVEIDESSRKEWLDRYEKWQKAALQERAPKNTPWPNASNVKFPTLTTAATQFQARAYSAIVDGSNLVKGRVLGPDPDGMKRERADLIGAHMTWQLLYNMPGWEEETDRLLLMLPIYGCVFRKTYYDSIGNTNCSEIVSAKDFVVNYSAKSLETAPRYTHILRYYPHEAKEKFAADLWKEVPVQADQESQGDEDAIVEFYEQHRYLDLDGDGYPEPFIVTTNKDGQVARIVPCFGPDDVTVQVAGKNVPLTDALQSGAAPEKIVQIKRRQYFVKYSFIPATDGSFYDLGFGALLEDISEPINTAINQMLDAAALQNTGGGFLGSGVNIRGGVMRFKLGEWKRVEVTTNAPLAQNIFRMDHPGPSPVLFQLLGQLVEASKDITAVQNVMTGEGTANQPATTTMALIEQGMKVMTAIFKRIHRSFGNELRQLFALNRDYLDDEEHFQLGDGDEPKRIQQQDYADNDLDVVPVSDPSLAMDMQKLARSEAEWQSFNGHPLVNQVELVRRRLEALGTADIQTMTQVPPPAPDPKLILARMEQARKLVESIARVSQQSALGAMQLSQAAFTAFESNLLPDAARLAEYALDLGVAAATSIGSLNNANPDGGGVPAMAGQPANPGVPSLAAPTPGPADGGLGAGAAPDPGATGPGSAPGPAVGGPV